MYDARDWYIEDAGFGISRYILEQSLDYFQETSIGIGGYPALESTFNFGRYEKRKVVLFVVGDEAFALEFHAKNYGEMGETFERMLISFEVYQ